MMTLIFDKVSKKINKHEVIREVSLKLLSGKIYGFKGINGSGKTMLMRLAAGLIYPTSGRILVDGKILGKDIGFPEKLGILIESPSFLNSYTGYMNLKFLADINNKYNKSVCIDSTLSRVGLEADDKRKYKKYSLGMKQRLGIAAAILEIPDIIILDEPTNALDSDGINLLKNIILEEKLRGSLILLSCHDHEFLQSIADELFFLEMGKLTGHSIIKEEGII